MDYHRGGSLDSIGLKYKTDKSSLGHDYLQLYERVLIGLQGRSIKLLEIGVYSGASIRTWLEYFPEALVVGMDINPNVPRDYARPVDIELADQSNVAQLVTIGTKHGPFDIIIDDGSHIWDHQITSLQYLLPYVKPSGFYILEDIHTSYGTHAETYKGRGTISAAKYLQALADYMIGDSVLDPNGEVDAFIRSFAKRLDYILFSRRTSILHLRDYSAK
jgi:hypothetical protein